MPSPDRPSVLDVGRAADDVASAASDPTSPSVRAHAALHVGCLLRSASIGLMSACFVGAGLLSVALCSEWPLLVAVGTLGGGGLGALAVHAATNALLGRMLRGALRSIDDGRGPTATSGDGTPAMIPALPDRRRR